MRYYLLWEKQVKKQLKLFLLILVCSFYLLPTVLKADPTFNYDELAGVLQLEYRTQLKQSHGAVTTLKKQEQAKRKAAKRSVNKQPKPLLAPKRHFPQVAKTTKKPEPLALFNAASSGNNNYIAKLLTRGISVNTPNDSRETALHMAAAHGHYSTVIYLLNHGANLHARTSNNWTALHHATRFRHANIASYLKQRGLSPYTQTTDGLNALDMAKSVNDQRLMNILGKR